MENNWTVDSIEDLQGRIIIVTGANSGIGYESTRIFASKGAKVIMACRSLVRAEQARDRILMEFGYANLVTLQLDLSDLDSVNSFADLIINTYDSLNILMNNAGIMSVPYGRTKDGFERQFGINYLGHFALTGRLLPLLERTSDGRIINISSAAHRGGDMDFSNLMYENGKDYKPMRAYSRSKLANLIFTYELYDRIVAAGYSTKVIAAHPGVSGTNLGRNWEGNILYKGLNKLVFKIVPSPYKGSLSGVRAATDRFAKGASYYGPTGFLELIGKPNVVDSNKLSKDKEVAERLWEESERLTGITYNFD